MIARSPNLPHRTRSYAPPQRLMRIVADTNTLVSGFSWSGPPGQGGRYGAKRPGDPVTGDPVTALVLERLAAGRAV